MSGGQKHGWGAITSAWVGLGVVASCEVSSPGPREAGPSEAAPGRPAAGDVTLAVDRLGVAVGAATRIAVGDLDADGRPELVAADPDALWVVDIGGRERARFSAPGGVQVLRVVDLDGDGRDEILGGWGRTRERLDAPARASIVRLQDGVLIEELIVAPHTARADIVDLRSLGPATSAELLVVHFESKYEVRAARARRDAGRWTMAAIDTIRMATSWAIGDVDGDGAADVVVGRLYGDDVGLDGDAFVLRPDGARVPIPIVGGVRAMALHDLDGDGVTDVLLGDGWNEDYGKVARALLSWARWNGRAFVTTLLDEIPEQYAVLDIIPADLDGDGRSDLVTRGDSVVRVSMRAADGWRSTTIATACRDAAVADLDGDRRPEILTLCEDGVLVR